MNEECPECIFVICRIVDLTCWLNSGKKPIKEKTNYVRVISVLTSFKNYINTSLFNLVKLLIKYTYNFEISYRTIE